MNNAVVIADSWLAGVLVKTDRTDRSCDELTCIGDGRVLGRGCGDVGGSYFAAIQLTISFNLAFISHSFTVFSFIFHHYFIHTNHPMQS